MKGESREIKGHTSTEGGRTWYGKRETLTPLSPHSSTKLSFVTTYHLAVKNLKTNTDGALESNTQSALAENRFSKHPIISYKKGASLKDTLVKVKT